MKPTQIIKLQDLRENLVGYLPTEQQPFVKSKAYQDLTLSLYHMLIASDDDKQEAKQVFNHERDNWNDFCKFEQKRLDGPELPELGCGSV